MQVDQPLRSCLYRGQVRHRRFAPARHEFVYPITYVMIDLDEWETVAERYFRTGPWANATLLRQDHLPPNDRSLREVVVDYWARQGVARHDVGAIRLLTVWRSWGKYFNPLSLFFCYRKADAESLLGIVAEVSNTPWNERHVYLLATDRACNVAHDRDRDELAPRRTPNEAAVETARLETCRPALDVAPSESVATMTQRWQWRHAKGFHVSPFLPLDLEYRWLVAQNSTQLTVHVDVCSGEQSLLDATLQLKQVEWSRANWRRARRQNLWLPGRLLGLIYYQAFRLWWKKTPFYAHPRKTRGVS